MDDSFYIWHELSLFNDSSLNIDISEPRKQ